MANKYEEEIEKDQLLRDSLILARITEIYREIRRKAQEEARSVVDKAAKDQAYFNQGTRRADFEIEFSNAVRPDYVKRDAFMKKVYQEEYFTSYYQSKYAVENQGIAKGFSFNLPAPKQKQFKEARDYALSKLMNKNKMTTGRNLNIAQLEDIIVSGVQRGLSLPNINKNMDIALGLRDEKGKWIGDIDLSKKENQKLLRGQRYQSNRILRTEIPRIRKRASIDQWVSQQDVVPSKMRLVAVRDNRVRQQSIQVDGKIANKEGKFQYPDGNYYYPGYTGRPEWDIQDREEVVPIDPDYPPETMIARDPKTGKNKIIPYKNAQEWVDDNNLTRNKYGEWISSKPKPKRVKKPKKIEIPKKVKSTVTKPKEVKKETPKKVVKPKEVKKTEPTKITKPKYTDKEINTLDSYGKNDYQQINEYLRSGKIDATTDEFKRLRESALNSQINTIDKSILKNTLQNDTTVYRGVRGFKNPKDLIGKIITTDAYSSTSTSLSTAKSFSGFGDDSVVFKIKAPKGTNYVNMKQFESGSTLGESELLFGRGKRLKITGFSEEKSGDLVLRTILEGEYE